MLMKELSAHKSRVGCAQHGVHLAREVIVADETYFSRLLDASPCRAPHLKWVSQLLAEFDEGSFAGEGGPSWYHLHWWHSGAPACACVVEQLQVLMFVCRDVSRCRKY